MTMIGPKQAGGQRLIEPAEPEHWASDNPSRLDGNRAGVDGRAAKLVAAVFAVGCACVASTHAAASQREGAHRAQLPPTYSQVEIDYRIGQLRQNTFSNVLTTQDLQNEVGKFYTKSDVDGLLGQIRKTPLQQSVTQPELNAAITKLDSKIQGQERQLSKTLEDQIKGLGGKIPTIPFWMLIGISLALLCAFIWVGWINATANAAATIEEARSIARTERADRFVHEWRIWMERRSGVAITAISTAGNRPLAQSALDQVIDVGNWFEVFAEAMHRGRVNIEITCREALDEKANEFWGALESRADQQFIDLRQTWAQLREYVSKTRLTIQRRAPQFSGSAVSTGILQQTQ